MRRRSPLVRVLVLATLAIGALCGSRAEASGLYSVTVLSYGNGGGVSEVSPKLDNEGRVLGSFVPSSNVNSLYPLIYDSQAGGKVTLLGITSPSGSNPGSYDSPGSVVAGNANGQVLGGFNSYPGLPEGTGFLESNGKITTLNLGALQGINDSGQIIYQRASSAYPQEGNFHDSYVYQNGTSTRIPNPPGSSDSEAVAINNAGIIAVNTTKLATAPDSGTYPVQGHSFLLDGSKWTELGTLGGPASKIMGLNASGDVTGWSEINANQDTHAMLVPFGKSMIDLGTLPGDTTSLGEGINKFGQVVGLSYGTNSTANYHGFLYQNGVMEDLNDLLKPNSGWSIKWGLAINDLGQILAYGDQAGGNADGDLLLLSPDGVAAPDPVYPPLPTPEPPTLAVFGLLAAGLAWRIRGRSDRREGDPERRPATVVVDRSGE